MKQISKLLARKRRLSVFRRDQLLDDRFHLSGGKPPRSFPPARRAQEDVQAAARGIPPNRGRRLPAGRATAQGAAPVPSLVPMRKTAPPARQAMKNDRKRGRIKGVGNLNPNLSDRWNALGRIRTHAKRTGISRAIHYTTRAWKFMISLFRSVACSIIAGSCKNARGKCNKKTGKIRPLFLPHQCHRHRQLVKKIKKRL